ncbi:MAG: KH domain-containing protein [Actinomycetota bacterium]|nr:KH domain-containing protein [Actinomycetota bacterium]
MAQTREDVTALVETLVRNLVDDVDAIGLDTYDEDGIFRIDITVLPDEVGKVIGRKGRMIKAIRTLARAAGSQAGITTEVEILG